MKKRNSEQSRKWVKGYTSSSALLLDYDDIPYRKVLRQALHFKKKHRLGSMLVVRSSRKHYHVIYSRRISYRLAQKIIDKSYCKSQKNRFLRKLRGDTTLRISGIEAKKDSREKPVIMELHGEPEGIIAEYMSVYFSVSCYR